jgi:hypothetical protein
VHVVHDLPHLVVESLFGLDDGLWGVLARGGFAEANRAAKARGSRRARLVTDVEFDELAAQNWAGHRVAKAATNAVTKRWQDGPDTPDLRRMGELADRLSDDTVQVAIDEVRRLSRLWQALAPGETLQLTWPYGAPAGPGWALRRSGWLSWLSRVWLDEREVAGCLVTGRGERAQRWLLLGADLLG